MKLPIDTPIWLSKIFEDLELRVESGILKADTADKSLKASGAFGLWTALKTEIEMAADKEQFDLRERNRSLNARSLAG